MPARPLVKGDDSEAGQPAGAFLVYRLDSAGDSSMPIVQTREDGQTIRDLAVPLDLRLQFIGGEAMQDARNLRLFLYAATQAAADLYAVVGLLGVGQAVDATAFELGTMRARVDMQLTLSAVLELEQPAEYIGNVQITVPPLGAIEVDEGTDPHGCS